MVHRLTLALTLSFLTGACGTYDPPPEVLETNLGRGVYDPRRGDIELTLSEPVDPTTLRVEVARAVFSVERDLCLPADDLPPGCAAAAEVVIGADSDRITLEEDRVIRIDGSALEPFSTYALRLASGLADEAGRARLTPVVQTFFVRGDVQGTATDFEAGMFFGKLNTSAPLPIEVNFYFWIEVSPEDGLIRVFGADADPVSGSPDGEETSLQQDRWRPDPVLPLGFTMQADGVIQETPDQTLLELLPFELNVATPPVLAAGAVFRGTVAEGVPPGDIGGLRELVQGQLDASAVYLGDTDTSIGAARGDLVMFRLTEEEAPPLSAILGEGVTEADVRSTFGR